MPTLAEPLDKSSTEAAAGTAPYAGVPAAAVPAAAVPAAAVPAAAVPAARSGADQPGRARVTFAEQQAGGGRRLHPARRTLMRARLPGAQSSPAPTVVVYHNFPTARSPLTDLLEVNTDPDMFRRHVRYFARNFDLITPSDLLGGVLPARPLLITFDDVYRSVLDIAGPILREFSAESIWFINPGTVAEQTLPLDNLLCLAVDRFGVADVARVLGAEGGAGNTVSSLIPGHVPGLTYAALRDLRTLLYDKLGGPQSVLMRESGLFLQASDLTRLRDYRIHVGNHSMSHTFFRALSPAELDVEIRLSHDLLEQLTGQAVKYLAIPYGYEADATPAALETARASGHEAIFLVHARSNTSRPASDVFYRVGPGNQRPELLPISIRVLPWLRSLWHRLHV